MNHEEAILLIPDFVLGRLRGAERESVAGHMARCEECRTQAEAYGEIGETLRLKAAAADVRHPTSDRLVAYSVAPATLRGQELEGLAWHLLACAECRDQVAAVRETESQFVAEAPSPRERARPRHLRPVLAAAAALVLLLAYPAYLGLFRAPSLASQLRDVIADRETLRGSVRTLSDSVVQLQDRFQAETTRSEGPLSLWVLPEAFRGVGETPRFRIKPDQSAVAIAIQPQLAGLPSGEGPLSFEVRRADGTAVSSVVLTVREVEELRSSSDGLLPLLIRAELLRPDHYTLTERDARGSILLQRPFEILE